LVAHAAEEIARRAIDQRAAVVSRGESCRAQGIVMIARGGQPDAHERIDLLS
jgi:hypothetical protein